MTFGLYLLLNLVIFLFFGIWIRRLVLKRLKPERILADLEAEVQGVIQSLNSAGDQNITLLEDRVASLNALLKHADTQIDEMQSYLRVIERALEEQDAAHEVESLPPGEGLHRVEAFPSESEAAEDEPTFNLTLRGGTVSPETLASGESEGEESPQSSGEPREQVLNLHAQGVSPDLIASSTGIAIGEVELIISLGARRPRS